MSDLATKTCVPCRGGVPPLKGKELEALARQTSPKYTEEALHRRHALMDHAANAISERNGSPIRAGLGSVESAIRLDR